MVFSSKDRILIKNLVLLMGYSSRRLLKEFPHKGWNKNGLDVLLRKIRSTGTVDRQPVSGRPRSVCTPENIDSVHDLVLSQDSEPHTHQMTHQITRKMGMSQGTIFNIIHSDLKLKCLKNRSVLSGFTDETIFTVAPRINSQNDRLYVASTTRQHDVSAEHLLRTRPTFSRSVMVSVAVSKLSCTKLFFVEPRVEVNGEYYRDVLMMQKMLPAIRYMSKDFFVFQQDSAPGTEHCLSAALGAPELTGPDLWPANSPDLKRVDYRSKGLIQERVSLTPIQNIDDLMQHLITVWAKLSSYVTGL